MKKIILLALVLASSSAWATGKKPPPPQAEADARAHAGAQAESAAHAGADAQAHGGTASSDATGGQASSSSSADGSNNSTTTNNTDNTFFALSTTFPQVSGCFKGAQGGAGASGGGLWFGRHGLDLDCFYSQIAEAEPEIEVQARLKCGSKAFRNAIAFEVPRRERQAFCVDYMVEKHRAELERLEAQVGFYEAERDRVAREAAQCRDELERSEEAWLECLEK